MRLNQLLSAETTCLNLQGRNKNELIEELIYILDKAGKLANRQLFKEAILKREADFSTGLENGIAVPHARTDAVKSPAIVIGISPQGVDYGALDDKPSKIFFMIAETENLADDHLEILSAITRHMKDAHAVEAILHAPNADELIQLFDEEGEIEAEPVTESLYPEIVAVTACPTGIAHTYMAASALEEKAKALRIAFKVETNGAIGVKNPLTFEDINHAKAVIVTADTQVDMGRFIGKTVAVGHKVLLKNS